MPTTTNNIIRFRDGLFALNTRRFGTVAELIIKRLYNFSNSHNLEYDALGSHNKRIEIKFSRVMKRKQLKITEASLIYVCLSESQSGMYSRFINSTDNKTAYNSNIQQIKPSCFDFLYYGLFFEDQIEIFRIKSTTLLGWQQQYRTSPKNKSQNVNELGYSPWQHHGNFGEGQFHITQDNIALHRKKYRIDSKSYEEIYNLFQLQKK